MDTSTAYEASLAAIRVSDTVGLPAAASSCLALA